MKDGRFDWDNQKSVLPCIRRIDKPRCTSVGVWWEEQVDLGAVSIAVIREQPKKVV